MAERQLQFQKTSSNIQAAFFDPDTQTVRVVFNSGHSGTHPATEEEAVAWEQASSPGSHYHTNFKAAGKTYNKIG